MPIYLWFVVLCVFGLFVFRFWPVSVSDISDDPFNTKPPQKPNYYISTDVEGEFAIPAIELQAALEALIAKQSRLIEVSRSDVAGYQASYVVRSFIMGFPDFLSIKIEENSPKASTIKLFSRSKFGYSDLGVNRKRIQGLLFALRQDLGA
jgi:uncharacterized protein (DUF1499 family)